MSTKETKETNGAERPEAHATARDAALEACCRIAREFAQASFDGVSVGAIEDAVAAAEAAEATADAPAHWLVTLAHEMRLGSHGSAELRFLSLYTIDLRMLSERPEPGADASEYRALIAAGNEGQAILATRREREEEAAALRSGYRPPSEPSPLQRADARQPQLA